MTKICTVLLTLLLAPQALPSDQYGAKIGKKTPVSLEKALTSFKQGDTSPQVVEAKVDKVCKKKGCWLALKNESGDLRVTFKDYGFFVPVSLIGKTVLVEGQLEEKKMDLKETKHYAEDAGEDPKLVKKAKTEYRMVASGVRVKE